MRSIVAALLVSAFAVTAMGSHHAGSLTPALPISQPRPEDVYSSVAAARHRLAQPPHWGSMVLMPQQR